MKRLLLALAVVALALLDAKLGRPLGSWGT